MVSQLKNKKINIALGQQLCKIDERMLLHIHNNNERVCQEHSSHFDNLFVLKEHNRHSSHFDNLCHKR